MLSAGTLLLDKERGQYLMLLKSNATEYHDGTAEIMWNVYNLTLDKHEWEWDFILDDVAYEVV